MRIEPPIWATTTQNLLLLLCLVSVVCTQRHFWDVRWTRKTFRFKHKKSVRVDLTELDTGNKTTDLKSSPNANECYKNKTALAMHTTRAWETRKIDQNLHPRNIITKVYITVKKTNKQKIVYAPVMCSRRGNLPVFVTLGKDMHKKHAVCTYPIYLGPPTEQIPWGHQLKIT